MKKILLFFCALIFAINTNAQQSFSVNFQHDGLMVNGTFTVPNGSGRFPTIIIAPGSGPNDRDATLPMVGGNVACLYPALLGDTLHPYRDLSDALVDSGYAVLRYDKVEYTYPTSLGTISFHKLWLPVESAIDYVKTRPDVDTTQIILLGHSEGSSLIPYIARGRNDVKALISVAGARKPLDSILAYQFVYITKTCGGDTVQAKAQAAQVLSYFDLIRTNNWNASTPALFGVPASVWYDYVNVTDSVAINYNLNNLPTLFLGLGLDINVPPAELIRFQNEVTITNDFWSIQGLIHYMTPNNDPRVSEALTDTIVYWLRQHNIVTNIPDAKAMDETARIFPNPFTNTISLEIEKGNGGVVSVEVFNALGMPVYSRQEFYASGKSVLTLDLKHLPSGVYFCRTLMGEKAVTKRVVKL